MKYSKGSGIFEPARATSYSAGTGPMQSDEASNWLETGPSCSKRKSRIWSLSGTNGQWRLRAEHIDQSENVTGSGLSQQEQTTTASEFDESDGVEDKSAASYREMNSIKERAEEVVVDSRSLRLSISA